MYVSILDFSAIATIAMKYFGFILMNSTVTYQIKGVSQILLGSTSSTFFSKGGNLGNASAINVIKDAKINTMIDVIEEYLEKAKTATNTEAHNKMRRNRPKPIPRTLGPSSAGILPSYGDDIMYEC